MMVRASNKNKKEKGNKRFLFLFLLVVFRTENILSVFPSSYRSICLRGLAEKLWKHSPVARVTTSFLDGKTENLFYHLIRSLQLM